MAKYKVKIVWNKQTDGTERYSWEFDNGFVLQNPATPNTQSEMIDPESAFVASVASCHMLSVFAIAAKRGLSVSAYQDEAIGVLEKNTEGRIAITRVLLRPNIEFEGTQMDESEIAALHDEANRNCFIANSIKTALHIET